MVRDAAGVDRVLLDPQARLVVEQAVQHVRRLAGGGGDHLGVERAVLVRHMGVERDARLVAVPGVDVGDRLAAAAGEEVLAVGLDVVPSPHTRASGSARCASMIRASASA